MTSIFLCYTIPQYTCGIRVDRGAAGPHYHRRRLRRQRQRALASKSRRMLRQYSCFCTSNASKVSTLGHLCGTPRSRGRSGPASQRQYFYVCTSKSVVNWGYTARSQSLAPRVGVSICTFVAVKQVKFGFTERSRSVVLSKCARSVESFFQML